MPQVLTHKRTKSELADFAARMNALNPQGFRQAPKKPEHATTVVEDLFIAAGEMERPTPTRSKRGMAKEKARAYAADVVIEQRENPDFRPAVAKPQPTTKRRKKTPRKVETYRAARREAAKAERKAAKRNQQQIAA